VFRSESIVVLALAIACSAGPDRVGSPIQRFVARAAGRVEVLDWGGRGTALLFLPGLGNTAHVYEEFAPRFRRRYRVLALTPRGFGESTPNDRGAPLDTVLADIAAVLDTLRLGKVVLVGHSLGGDVATSFAVAFPNRVAAVIYLEGANDRRPGAQPPPNAPWPAPPAMTRDDSASASAYQRYVERTFGPRLPLQDIRATTAFDSAGRFAGGRTPDSVVAIIVGSIAPPPYRQVSVPALAIYSEPDPSQYDLPYWNRLSGADARTADSLQAWLVRSAKTNEDSVRAMLHSLEVVRVPRSGHLIFLLSPDVAEHAMRRFLDSVAL